MLERALGASVWSCIWTRRGKDGFDLIIDSCHASYMDVTTHPPNDSHAHFTTQTHTHTQAKCDA